jgi:hypothetical protein
MVRVAMSLLLAGASVTLSAGSASRVEHVPSGAAAISVGVVAAPDVRDAVLARMFDEAAAIWSPTGIELDWHRVSSNAPPSAWQLTVTIDDQPKEIRGRQTTLGWIPFTPTGPAPSIHLSRANVEALMRSTTGVGDATVLGHEILLGRALGRALSHELGHYFLRTRVHTPRGLMRAAWSSAELLGLDRRGFELDADQRATAERLPAGAGQ